MFTFILSKLIASKREKKIFTMVRESILEAAFTRFPYMVVGSALQQHYSQKVALT